MKQPNIETQLLILRPYVLQDAPQIQKLAGNKNVSALTLNIPHPYKNGMAEQWLATHTKSWRLGEAAIYAITIKSSGQLIGTVSLVDINNKKATLSYWIGEEYWGNGYCTEAANALVQFAICKLDINKISAHHLSCNRASGSVMRKIGMHHISSTLEKDRDGNPAKVECYEITNIPKRTIL